jgi:N-acetylglucosamine-6-phosphate deacetylase
MTATTIDILAQRVFDGARWHGPSLVRGADGLIAGFEPAPRALPEDCIRLPDDAILAPGFIDVQVNGGGGVLLNDDPSVASVRRIAETHRRFGTTGLLPALITDAPEKLQRLAAVASDALDVPGVLGFHLEGPALNPARRGIHPPQHIRAPTQVDTAALVSFGSIGRSLVTLAPEQVDGDFIRTLSAAGLRVAAGHSEATAAQIQAAAEAGLTGITHLFNAMSQMTAREPGTVGAALADERLFASVICDGLHVDPLNLKVALRVKTRERLMLVTDAMATAGSDLTTFRLLGRDIMLNNGRLTGHDGTLAGAHLTMIEAVHNAVTLIGASLEDALVMASRTPAEFLGLSDRLGQIAEGYSANLVAFTPDWRVLGTWIGASVLI